MMAASAGDFDTLGALLAAGADPNANAADGVTALRLANRHPEIAKQRKKAGGQGIKQPRTATVSGDNCGGERESPIAEPWSAGIAWN
jgi:hypothetical protein